MSAIDSPDFEVAYLGPVGSFSHLVAQRRYPGKALVPLPSVPEIFDFLAGHSGTKAIVPVENSSAGLILPTIDELIEHACTLFIEEEISLNVKLALLGRRGEPIHTIYSHFAPLHHCEPYLKERYPEAKAVPCSSTSASAEAARKEPGAAVIGQMLIAELYGLDVLDYPIREDVPNVTQFFVMGHERKAAALGEKTTLVVALPNRPGGLYEFLKPFAEAEVNLTRIESRPIVGQPNTYRFLLEVHGTENQPAVRRAFEGAERVSTQFHNVGAYPVLPRIES